MDKMRGKRKVAFILTALLITSGLTGCGENQIPDLSEDDIKAVGEFVAVTMMKYDINHRSRLMELTNPALEEKAEEPGEGETSEENTGMPPVADTPVVDATGTGEVADAAYSLEEVMGLPTGIEVAFREQELCDSYPAEGDFFSLNASQGKKLLVLHFTLTNTGSDAQNVDVLASGTTLSVTVNENYTRRALTTMLLEDLSTYMGEVPAGETVETVLVIEISEETAANISTVSIQAKNEERTSVRQIF